MQVHPLGWENPLEKGMAIHSVSLSGEFHGQRSLQAAVLRTAKSRMRLKRLSARACVHRENKGLRTSYSSDTWESKVESFGRF